MQSRNYASNSHKSKTENAESLNKKHLKPVVKCGVSTKKKGNAHKMLELFVGDDIQNVKSYMISDVIIPAVKAAIVDTIETALYGEAGRRRSRGNLTASRVSYNRFFNERDARRRTDSRRESAEQSPDYDELIFESRADAEAVLDELADTLQEYGVVSITDLYELANVTSRTRHTDNKYGWTTLATARVVSVRGGGWRLDMPRVMVID